MSLGLYVHMLHNLNPNVHAYILHVHKITKICRGQPQLRTELSMLLYVVVHCANEACKTCPLDSVCSDKCSHNAQTIQKTVFFGI